MGRISVLCMLDVSWSYSGDYFLLFCFPVFEIVISWAEIKKMDIVFCITKGRYCSLIWFGCVPTRGCFTAEKDVTVSIRMTENDLHCTVLILNWDAARSKHLKSYVMHPVPFKLFIFRECLYNFLNGNRSLHCWSFFFFFLWNSSEVVSCDRFWVGWVQLSLLEMEQRKGGQNS